MLIKNISVGPKAFNVRLDGAGIGTATLQPGQTAELDVLDPESRVFRAWVNDRHILVDGVEPEPPRLALSSNPQDPAGYDAVQRAALDTERRTVPHQLSGDGGPNQGLTYDGNAGAPTGAQGEGTVEQRAGAAPVTPVPVPQTPDGKPRIAPRTARDEAKAKEKD